MLQVWVSHGETGRASSANGRMPPSQRGGTRAPGKYSRICTSASTAWLPYAVASDTLFGSAYAVAATKRPCRSELSRIMPTDRLMFSRARSLSFPELTRPASCPVDSCTRRMKTSSGCSGCRFLRLLLLAANAAFGSPKLSPAPAAATSSSRRWRAGESDSREAVGLASGRSAGTVARRKARAISQTFDRVNDMRFSL